MTEPRICAYCGDPIDVGKPFWVLERWEGGRAVARGYAGSYGCLHAISAFQGPREMPPSRGSLTPIEPAREGGVIEPGVEHDGR
jgi:hypothetical protein